MTLLRLALLFSLILVEAQAQQGEIQTPGEKGKYDGSNRIGIWEYRDHPGKVSLKVDYTNQRLIYIEPDTSDFFIQENNQWVKSKLEIPCRFHGSRTLLESHYLKFSFPFNILDKGKTMSVFLTFEVNENGEAENPEVINDPGYKVKDQLIKLFNSAPNIWIVGIKKDGSAVRCKMGIEFSICENDLCTESNKIIGQLGVKAKLMMRNRIFYRHSPAFRRNVPEIRMPEGRGIQFSPDDRKILFEDQGGAFIADVQTKEIESIPFTNIVAATWQDNDRIVFKYQYQNWSPLAALYDLSSKEVTGMSDSLTYFHMATNPPGGLTFIQPSKNGITVWQQNTSTLKARVLLSNLYVNTIPLSWSRDTTKLILKETENGFTKYVVFDTQNKEKTIVPLYNTFFLGWSWNNADIFLLKTSVYPKSLGKAYRFNVSTGELIQLTEDIKDLYRAIYNPADKKLLLNIKNDIYQYDAELHKMSLLMNNVISMTLSNDGNKLAVIIKEKQQTHLSIYDLKSGRSELLKSWDSVTRN